MEDYVEKLNHVLPLKNNSENLSKFDEFAKLISSKNDKEIHFLWFIEDKTGDSGLQLLLKSSIPAHTVERTFLNGWIADNLGSNIEIIYDYEADFLSDGNLVKGSQDYLKKMLDEKHIFRAYPL